jgi:predicted transglutaminase-like cysteine proteinase
MRWDMGFKAALAALLLLAPAPAMADSVFDGGMMGSRDFLFFPFWQKVLTDVGSVPLAPPTLMMASNTGQSGNPGVAALPSAFMPGTAGGPAAGIVPAIYTTGVTPAITTPGMPAAPTAACASERSCAPPEWLTFLDTLRGQGRLGQLQAVNQWANAKPYVDDFVNWRVPDYWETPGEFIAHGGDCEDYAIAKYFSLVRLGFPVQDLRIVVVDDSAAHVFHAVLAARLDGVVWLLDNLNQNMVAMNSVTHYTPVYSLNQEGWWMHSNPVIHLPGATIAAGPQLAMAAGH